MPKQVITKDSLKKIMTELDRWQGKLTWPLFCEHIAKVLKVDKIERQSLAAYPAIQDRFTARKQEFRDAKDEPEKNYTLDYAIKRMKELEAENKRLNDTNEKLIAQFVRWQYNLYANNVRMDKLDQAIPVNLDRPLPAISRANSPNSKKY